MAGRCLCDWISVRVSFREIKCTLHGRGSPAVAMGLAALASRVRGYFSDVWLEHESTHKDPNSFFKRAR